MTFGSPMLRLLVLLVPVVAVLFVYAHRQRQGALDRLLSVEALRNVVPAGARAARTWQAIAGFVVMAGLAFAASQPQFGFTWEQRTAKGLNIVVILDVSRSMDAEDVSPSRIDRARRELTDFVGLLRGDSVGLVLVANGAFVRLPLTTDYGTFLWVLGDSSTQTITAQGTAMSGGIDSATQMLSRGGAAGRAILVVSDGELHDAPEALSAALVRAREADVHIYALGVGEAAGAPIPIPEGGFKKDRTGGVVMTKLNADSLRALAAATDGAYVQAVAGDDDVQGLYEGEIRGKLKAEERQVKREQIPNEGYQWPLALALIALAGSAWAGIGPRRRSTGVLPTLVARFVLALPGFANAGAREEGLDALKRMDWSTAIDKLGQAQVDSPLDPTVGQGLGEALYRGGRYREAEQVFLALAARDPDHAPLAYYNAGNAAYRDGRLERAVEHYSASQQRDAKLASAVKNGEAVAKEIARREAPEEPEPQDGEPQDGEPQQGEPQQGEPQEGEAGQEQPAGSENAAEGDTGTPKAGVAGEPDPDAAMTPEEAARLVDAVMDGRPRTRVSGDTTEKDW